MRINLASVKSFYVIDAFSRYCYQISINDPNVIHSMEVASKQGDVPLVSPGCAIMGVAVYQRTYAYYQVHHALCLCTLLDTPCSVRRRETRLVDARERGGGVRERESMYSWWCPTWVLIRDSGRRSLEMARSQVACAFPPMIPCRHHRPAVREKQSRIGEKRQRERERGRGQKKRRDGQQETRKVEQNVKHGMERKGWIAMKIINRLCPNGTVPYYLGLNQQIDCPLKSRFECRRFVLEILEKFR